MRRVLLQLALHLIAGVFLAAVAVTPASADAGDEYTEVVPEAGGKKPSQEVNNDGGSSGGGATDGAPEVADSSETANSEGSTQQSTGSQARSKASRQETKTAKTLAKATAPDSAALKRSILERRGVDDDRIANQLAESGANTSDSYLGGGGGIALALPVVLGLSLLATLGLMWQRRSD